MTHKFDQEVQGVALYLEFRKPNATCQVIVTPDGFTESTGVAQAMFYRRVITSGVSKRRWKGYPLPLQDNQRLMIEAGEKTTEQEMLERSAERFGRLHDYFHSLVRNGYELVLGKPIYVEVSKDDLTQIKSGTLPTKLWTRVKSTRTAFGFPETPVDEA